MEMKLHPVDLPLRHTFTIAHGSRSVQPSLIVELIDGPYRGYGEGCPLDYYGVTVEAMTEALESARRRIEAWRFEWIPERWLAEFIDAARQSGKAIEINTKVLADAEAAAFQHYLGLVRESGVPVEVEAETPFNEKIVTLVQTLRGREILVSRPAGTPGPTDGNAHLAVDTVAALLFDRESGRRIVPDRVAASSEVAA